MNHRDIVTMSLLCPILRAAINIYYNIYAFAAIQVCFALE